MDSRDCSNCGEGFLPNKHNQRYCAALQTAACDYCSAPFQRPCTKKLKRSCSRSCASKLIRREQAERSSGECLSCGKSFPKKISAQVYCYEPLAVSCEGACGRTVETSCGKSPKRFCTPTCRQLHMRATAYKIAPKDCVICSESFVPLSSKSMVCAKDHSLDCLWCGEGFVVDIQSWSEEGKGKYCSNSCSTLGQTGSKLRRELTAEYKAIDGWALKFREEQRRKPTPLDVHFYFGVGIPARADRSLFRIEGRGGSGFEKHVVRLIQESWPLFEVLRNKRPVRSISGGHLEIDIWLPGLGLGFEVQDFATHSKLSDSEPSRMHYADFKAGPSYHRAKIEAADRVGIEIVEIWEDEILSGQALSILQAAITRKLNDLSSVSVL